MIGRFTAPFWFLIILGIVSTIMPLYTIYALRVLVQDYPVSTRFILFSFCWPAVIFLEGIVYWIIRNRNKYRRASWTHVVLFTLAFFTPLLSNLLFEFHDNFITGMETGRFMRVVNMIHICTFWACMIVGHAYFGWLLVKCYAKEPPTEDEGSGTINILDDVIS